MPKIYKEEMNCPACGRRENEEEEVEDGHVFRFLCFVCSYAEIVYKGSELEPLRLVASGFMDSEGARSIVGDNVVNVYDKQHDVKSASVNPNHKGFDIPKSGGFIQGW